MYGKRKSAKRSTSSRAGITIGKRVLTALKKVGAGKYTKKTVKRGYSTDNEKKYHDIVRIYSNWSKKVISYASGSGSAVVGLKFHSGGRNSNSEPGDSEDFTNVVTGIGSGATVNNRIGNKINIAYLKVGFTIQAAFAPQTGIGMGGEIVNQETPAMTESEYMKTSFRIVVVKDKQTNNSTNSITWDNVFGLGPTGADSGQFASFGATDELDIQNMGRFIIVKDIRCIVDATDPMKVIKFTLKNLGEIRYNGNATNALTNIGYHILVAQDVLGSATSDNRVSPGGIIATTRLCFKD